VAICSASTISYEYSCVGGILFVYQTVSNQKNIYSFLVKSEAAFPVKRFDQIFPLLENKKFIKNYFENRNKYFPGNSDANLVSIFEDLEKERGLTIRLAEQKDVLTYFKWVNDSNVRINSIRSSTISMKDHKTWFHSKLKNKNSLLYLISKNGIPLGQVRFDKEKSSAEIDYSIGKAYRGKGYGEIILKNAIKEYFIKFPKDKIIAKAKESNIPSNRVFKKLGFKKASPIFINGAKYYSYFMKGN
nr:GNAT family N-acetyltransferase [Bacteroidota bacterium]